MKMSRPLWVLGLTIPLAACGGPSETADAGTVGDAGPSADAPSGSGDAGRDAGPTNDSFDGARPVTTDGTAVNDAIEVPGDRDFWSFEGTAGDWIAINTNANADDNPDMVDTVITLYDSTRTQIAENDDSVPRVNTDSEIIIRLPSTGTYYIEVQEFSTWMPADPPAPEGRNTFTYELTVTPLTNGGAVNIDAEPGNDASTAATLGIGGMNNNVAFIMGAFDGASDVDVWAFTVPAAGGGLLSIDVMPAGADGYGSTRPAGNFRVTDMAGSTVIARIEPRAMMQADLSPSLVPGQSYLLWAEAGGGTAGSNDQFVLKAFFGDENPDEMETTAGSNDMPTTATAVTMTPDDAGVPRGFLFATLPSGDVDFFSFDVPAGRQINVFCGGQSVGSGLRGVSAQLYDGDGTMALGTAGSETATDGVAITGVMPRAAGTHYLKLTASSQDPAVQGDFIRCGIALTDPAAMM